MGNINQRTAFARAAEENNKKKVKPKKSKMTPHKKGTKSKYRH